MSSIPEEDCLSSPEFESRGGPEVCPLEVLGYVCRV